MNATATPNEAARRAIAVLGGPSQAARRLNVKGHRHQTVQAWLKARIPAEYCPLIERETRLLGDAVSCEQLRPDVMWGVLREPIPATAALQPEEVSHGA